MNILMCEALRYDAPVRVGSHHYARAFRGDGHQVLWLGSSYHAAGAVLGLLGVRRHAAAAAQWRDGPMRLEDGTVAYHPVTCVPFRDRPLLRNRWVLQMWPQLCVPPLRCALRRVGFDTADVLWLSQSHAALHLARSFRCGKMVYRMSDRYADFEGVPKVLRRAEQEVLARADVVFFTAKALADQVPRHLRHKAVYLPNGVELSHFQRKDLEEPSDLTGLPRPRLIYVGTVGHWVDVALLAATAEALGDHTLLIVGPVHADCRGLAALPNVRLLGVRAYAELPAYLAHCDVGLIPFRKSRLTDAVNPVKLFEYFAAGLPVVATDLEELAAVESPALLARTPGQFVECVREAIAGGRDHEAFATFARENTWQARYDVVRELCRLPGATS